MIRLHTEIDMFRRCSQPMRTLMLANSLYALLLPVIEIFVAAYVMRSAQDPSRVMAYQLAVYTATPLAFLANGFLLRRVAPKHLYSAGILLSGAAMLALMHTTALTLSAVAATGLGMGFATGLFWANRVVLVLFTTRDANRNYYYGVELFFATLASVAVPALVGWVLAATTLYGWFAGAIDHAYRAVALAFALLTLGSAAIVQSGRFEHSSQPRFLYLHFPRLWRRMLQLTALKGVAQGYILTAPAMLIMLLVGQEGTLGATLSIGGILTALILYSAGRLATGRHRHLIFAAGLVLFFAGACANAILFSAAGVFVFATCLMLAKPLLDLGYNPIELRVVDAVRHMENRDGYAYLFNHELALFAGRACGCLLFLGAAWLVSATAALRYALLAVAALQLLSIPLARRTLLEADAVETESQVALTSSGA